MLRTFVIYFGGKMDEDLPLVELSDNSRYHFSIGMPPFESII